MNFIEKSNIKLAVKFTRPVFPLATEESIKAILDNLFVVDKKHRPILKEMCLLCYHLPKTQHCIVQHSNNHFKNEKIKFMADEGGWELYTAKRALYEGVDYTIYHSNFLKQYENLMNVWSNHLINKTNVALAFEELYIISKESERIKF